ncbi:MAG: hypothetical protein DMF86_15110 [Acidobacteria bacterium]|nr:MAG: hypothetical protein DMF86_15110 [Acidobacteriota bacterium]
MNDISYAIRRLFKSPGFTIVAVLTLALGIGANTAIFSVVDGVLLKPLPFPEPNRLVGVYHVSEGHRAVMSGPNFTDVARASQSLESAAAISREREILTGQGEPVRIDVAQVSAAFFSVLRAQPALGRVFRADENTPGKTRLIILSDGLWRERFGGDPQIVGRAIQLDGVSKEVIGVMPRGFSFPAQRQAWEPIEYDANFASKQRGAWYVSVIARLKPGVTAAQAAVEVENIGRNLARQYPDMNEGVGMTVYPLLDSMVGEIRRSVLVLLGAVGFVLLIACANVANLLLARAAARQSEMAIRTALGAGRGRLVRQLLTESVILSVVGGGLGLLFAVWAIEVLLGLQPEGIPRLDNVRMDAAVVAFTFALAALTGVVFGIVPALAATRDPVSSTLKESGRGALTSAGGARLRGLLVIVEVALAVMLLAGAGLLIRSFARLQAVDPGFRPDRTLTFDLTLPGVRYEQDPPRVAFFDELFPRLRALPGVESVAAVMGLPLSGMNFNISFEIGGRPPVPPSQQPAMEVRVASADYFRTVGIPLKRGRYFTDDDRASAPQVAIITESAARQYFPNEDPIGKTINLGWGRQGAKYRAGGRVVGIVGDVKDAGLNEPNPPEIYLPYRQWPVESMSVLMRTAVPPRTLSEAIRRDVYGVDANLPVSNLRTLDEIVSRSISQPRFYMTLLAVFAAVALALAAIGIFGVLSYAVAQRTREIGIRMALGAASDRVLRLVVGRALALTGIAIVIGAIGATALARLLGALLFGVGPADPATFAAAAATLALVGALAAYLPARRAARIDPVRALAEE